MFLYISLCHQRCCSLFFLHILTIPKGAPVISKIAQRHDLKRTHSWYMTAASWRLLPLSPMDCCNFVKKIISSNVSRVQKSCTCTLKEKYVGWYFISHLFCPKEFQRTRKCQGKSIMKNYLLLEKKRRLWERWNHLIFLNRKWKIWEDWIFFLFNFFSFMSFPSATVRKRQYSCLIRLHIDHWATRLEYSAFWTYIVLLTCKLNEIQFFCISSYLHIKADK